ncbi:MAG: metallophosphoesterase [Candidatus Aminicenantes bacterium]|nr:metallophosphoesterase [Candidatus Aminicenantes bacterium]
MFVFLAVAISIYGLVNFYVARRGAQALGGYPTAKVVFMAAFIALALAYPLGRVLMALGRNSLSSPFIMAGSFHMIVMLYGFLGAVIIDLVRLLNAFVHFLPKSFSARPGPAGLVLFLAVAGITALSMAAGAYNAVRPRTVELALNIPKKAGGMERLTIVLASDLHLGTLVGRSRLEKIIERINALTPDIVFLPGDIVDETVTAKDEAEFSAIMRRLRAPLGVFAVPGNHEFYSGLERNLAFLRACDIKVLEDEAVNVAGAFVLVGRRDPSSLTPKESRLPIRDILAKHGFDDRLPVILLDHQPAHLEEASQAGVDLQLSGHTHAGQLFPLDIINRIVWELNWGYLRKGNTQYYVTSGVGTWGPPVRTGSRPEIVRIRLTFDGGRGSTSAVLAR